MAEYVTNLRNGWWSPVSIVAPKVVLSVVYMCDGIVSWVSVILAPSYMFDDEIQNLKTDLRGKAQQSRLLCRDCGIGRSLRCFLHLHVFIHSGRDKLMGRFARLRQLEVDTRCDSRQNPCCLKSQASMNL